MKRREINYFCQSINRAFFVIFVLSRLASIIMTMASAPLCNAVTLLDDSCKCLFSNGRFLCLLTVVPYPFWEEVAVARALKFESAFSFDKKAPIPYWLRTKFVTATVCFIGSTLFREHKKPSYHILWRICSKVLLYAHVLKLWSSTFVTAA